MSGKVTGGGASAGEESNLALPGTPGTPTSQSPATLQLAQPSQAGSTTAAAGRATAPASDQSQVTVLMDGARRTFTMRINGETVLEAGLREGLELPFSCRSGVCSTCRTKVVSGEVLMDQNYALDGSELEQGYVLVCQSRVQTPTLEIDYDEK